MTNRLKSVAVTLSTALTILLDLAMALLTIRMSFASAVLGAAVNQRRQACCATGYRGKVEWRDVEAGEQCAIRCSTRRSDQYHSELPG